jgi:hypothetical protein
VINELLLWAVKNVPRSGIDLNLTFFFLEGTLELVVTTAKTSVRAEVQARSRGLYDVTFVPQEISPHFVNITFNDQVILLV